MVERDAGVVMATSQGDSARLVVAGRPDPADCDRIAGLLDDVRAPRAVVRVDLSRATSLPVALLRCLMTAARRLADGGGGLVVVDPSAAAVRTLRTSGLHRVLAVEGWPTAAEHLEVDAGA